eukprot:7202536-Pyramimonas_sp.AAC.1
MPAHGGMTTLVSDTRDLTSHISPELRAEGRKMRTKMGIGFYKAPTTTARRGLSWRASGSACQRAR